MTLTAMGVPHELIVDVGVAGLHRLLPHVPTLQRACAVVAIAGMEGALASVIGGLVACPVYAVPTSVGYGISLGGVAALMAMLNSCASNVSVVNIDNGFGAAVSAGLVSRAVRNARTADERG
jgi:NCAIR mutase (PurE)-related protein